MIKKEETEDPFPVCIIEINRGDIECAACTFDEETQKILERITWDAVLLDKIAENVRRRLKEYYSDCDLLPRAIEEVLKETLEEVREKRTFLSALRAFVKRQ